MIKVSYAVTVCNELNEIRGLIPFLLEYARPQDEIVVLYDRYGGTDEVLQYLESIKNDKVKIHTGAFRKDFAAWKNKLTGLCEGDYVYQIDADETPSIPLMENIHSILQHNSENEVYLVPRVNIVNGLTPEHIKKWGWKVDKSGYVNFPDYQWRIYKNTKRIKWINKVHERLDGFKTYAPLPPDINYALMHIKDIERQEKQNEFYENLS